MPKYFNGEIVNGQLSMDRDQVRRTIRSMPEGQYLMILVRMDNDRDEREWQKWYRVLLKGMADDTGHSPEEMHEFAKAEVLSEMELDSTTQLNPASWREYIERLGDWALDKFGFVI